MTSPVEVPGPWRHRYVAANGARFHIAESSPTPTGLVSASPGRRPDPGVLLLHGFPQFWWAWRHQLPALAEQGYRALAMDLRGYGGSDKTPRGYDPFTLAGDVAGVIKALGLTDCVVVGHGWGGYVGWVSAVLHPARVRALCAVCAPHPLVMLEDLRVPGRLPGALVAHLLAMQVPMRPERALADPGSGLLARHLRSWSGPGSGFPDQQTLSRYQTALDLWPAPHCALEYHRWLARSRLRGDGRRFTAAMRRPVTQPTYTVFGGSDPALPDPARDRSAKHVRGHCARDVVAGAGHFLPEEAPDELSALLRDWLARLDH